MCSENELDLQDHLDHESTKYIVLEFWNPQILKEKKGKVRDAF